MSACVHTVQQSGVPSCQSSGTCLISAKRCCVLRVVSQPPLGFTAPELVGGVAPSAQVVLSGAADCFSLAALTVLLVTGACVGGWGGGARGDGCAWLGFWGWGGGRANGKGGLLGMRKLGGTCGEVDWIGGVAHLGVRQHRCYLLLHLW